MSDAVLVFLSLAEGCFSFCFEADFSAKFSDGSEACVGAVSLISPYTLDQGSKGLLASSNQSPVLSALVESLTLFLEKVSVSISTISKFSWNYAHTLVVRNTYSLLDWGDFVDETSAARGDPYVQLLSVTKPDDAHKDFVQLRLNGIDTSGDAAHKLLDHGKSSPVPTSEKIQHVEGFVRIC